MLPYREGEGFLLVYSITARATFERIEKFRNQILRVQDRDDVPMVLVGNKVDRAASDREVSTQEAEALARQMGCDLGKPSSENSCRFISRPFETVPTLQSKLLPKRATTLNWLTTPLSELSVVSTSHYLTSFASFAYPFHSSLHRPARRDRAC